MACGAQNRNENLNDDRADPSVRSFVAMTSQSIVDRNNDHIVDTVLSVKIEAGEASTVVLNE